MSEVDLSRFNNTLLKALSPDDFALFQPHLERFEVPRTGAMITPDPVGARRGGYRQT